MQTVRKAITGHEYVGVLDYPEQALAQFYRAFNERDIRLMKDNWDTSDEVAMDNPLGGIARGWNELRNIYERIFASRVRVRVEFYDYTIHDLGEVFYAVGRERGLLESDSVVLDLAIRTSRVFRKVEGRWRQVHHHGSIDDPELLARYQSAVEGKS